ncbi:MAG: patatin-like phospholipase family protein [Nitrospirota bacterium]|nr:patatin-like phospholipase family protein [Nitrospirota bacterium]
MNDDVNDNRINLVISGGGVRLSAYLGALQALDEMGVKVASVAGASAGAIIASYFAAGWSLKDMLRLVMETDFTQFKDFSLRSLVFRSSIYSGTRFEKWMNKQLEYAAFENLEHDLFVTAVDLVSREPVFFSRHNTPDMAVGKAVRYSMSIPGVWPAQKWEGRLLVDGNILPWIHSAIKEMHARQNGSAPGRTLVLSLASARGEQQEIKENLYPWNMVKILLDTMMTALDNQRVPGQLWHDTILINTGDYYTLQFDLKHADKEKLFEMGYEQTKRYFHKNSLDGNNTMEQATRIPISL